MGERTAFFYGTLMAPEILFRVIYGDGQVNNDPIKRYLADQLTFRPAVLNNHCRHRVQGADYPGVIPENGHSVKGTYVTGLTDGDIYRLDKFEGSEYTRQFVTVIVGGNEAVQAETYMYTDGEEFLEQREWDYEEFRRAKLHKWTGASPEFQEVDQFVAGNPESSSVSASTSALHNQDTKVSDKGLNSAGEDVEGEVLESSA